MTCAPIRLSFFFFNDPATTEIYTLPLHDALPISSIKSREATKAPQTGWSLTRKCFKRIARRDSRATTPAADRKSTRLNSSHSQISYAVFCLKKKKKKQTDIECTTYSSLAFTWSQL